MFMTRDDILSTLKTHLPELMNHGIEKIGIFGSVTRLDFNADSDIDILVSFQPGEKTFDNYMDLKFLLETILKCQKIDLVIEDSLKDRVKPYIYQELIYAS